MRRRVLIIAVSALSAGALVLGTGVGTAGASVGSAKKPVCAGKTKKQAVKDIKTAYAHFLDGSKYPDAVTDKEPYIQFMTGSDVSPAFKAQFEASSAANASAAATTSVKVSKVKCTGKKSANVDFDLVLNGQVTPDLAPPGDAVFVDNVWKVSGVTLCNTQALGSPQVLEAGPCSEILLEGEPSDLTAG
jgi:hypothetical protein